MVNTLFPYHFQRFRRYWLLIILRMYSYSVSALYDSDFTLHILVVQPLLETLLETLNTQTLQI